jgi:hypothetical protein
MTEYYMPPSNIVFRIRQLVALCILKMARRDERSHWMEHLNSLPAAIKREGGS